MADFKMPTETEIWAFHEKAQEAFHEMREAEKRGDFVPESLQKKMDDQALTHAALADENSPARKAYDKVMSIPYDEFYGVAGQDQESTSDEDAA